MAQVEKVTPVDGLPTTQGEVMRSALRIIKTRGDEALDYATRKAEWMADNGDQEDEVFWQNISRQIEILLYQND